MKPVPQVGECEMRKRTTPPTHEGTIQSQMINSTASRPGTLYGYIDRVIYWAGTPEGHYYWENLHAFCKAHEDKNTQDILDKLPEIFERQPDPVYEDYTPYQKLRILGKFYERFGTLPTAEVFQSLQERE